MGVGSWKTSEPFRAELFQGLAAVFINPLAIIVFVQMMLPRTHAHSLEDWVSLDEVLLDSCSQENSLIDLQLHRVCELAMSVKMEQLYGQHAIINGVTLYIRRNI